MASTQITGQSGLAFLPYGVSPGTRAADPLVAQPSVASPGVSTTYSAVTGVGHNAFASWVQAVDPRFWFVVVHDVFFGNRADGWAVTDDFGNLVLVRI